MNKTIIQQERSNNGPPFLTLKLFGTTNQRSKKSEIRDKFRPFQN